MSRTAVVVGAGLAGTATALALARRGLHVTLVDGGAGASDVPLAVLAPYPVPPTDALTRLRGRGARFTRALVHHLEARGLDAGRRADGVLLVPASARERRRRARVPAVGPGPTHVVPAEAQARHGVTLGETAIHHPGGACIEPGALRAAMRRAAGDDLAVTRTRVARLAWRDPEWILLDAADRVVARSAAVVLALGPGADGTHLHPALQGLTTPVRGQVTAFAATAVSARLPMPISSGGYVTPAVAGVHWAGASHERGARDTAPRDVDDAANAERVRALWPQAPPAACGRFVGIRAATGDRMPRVGPLAPGLWVNTGHGSHGLMTAPLAGHLLARAVAGHTRHPALARLRPWCPVS